MGCAVNMALTLSKSIQTDDATRHKASLFFTCLDPRAGTDSAVWYRRLKDQIVRWGFQYSMDNGEDLDKSDTPLYPVDVRLICQALALHGTAESAAR
jgi:hypothetical protein